MGLFVYYGDNKKPGHELHDTRMKGNELLRFVYDIMECPGGDVSMGTQSCR